MIVVIADSVGVGILLKIYGKNSTNCYIYFFLLIFKYILIVLIFIFEYTIKIDTIDTIKIDKNWQKLTKKKWDFVKKMAVRW